MRWILAMSLLFGGILAGCATDDHRSHEPRTHEGPPVSRQGDAQEEKYPQTDPVCGMRVNPRSAAGREEFGGKTYFFDTDECRQKFHENPQAYIPGADRGTREVR